MKYVGASAPLGPPTLSLSVHMCVRSRKCAAYFWQISSHKLSGFNSVYFTPPKASLIKQD